MLVALPFDVVERHEPAERETAGTDAGDDARVAAAVEWLVARFTDRSDLSSPANEAAEEPAAPASE